VLGEGGLAIPDITQLSLRARLAIALRLFAGYCIGRRLEHLEIDAYLNHLWRFVGMDGSPEAFGAWTGDEPPLIGVGLGDEYPPEFAESLAACGVTSSEFRRAISCATEVLYGSLYGASDELGSRQYLSALAELVAPLGVGFPELEVYAESRWADGSGWGAIPTAEAMQVWRSGDLTEPGSAPDHR
jgi:hypothetical protein